MSPHPARAVVSWLNRQDSEDLYLTAITIAEIGHGLYTLPEGKRRRALTDRFDRFVERGFEDRVLGFDLAAARAYWDIMGRRRAMGRPIGALDGQIAAIARINRSALATRNVRDFEETGLQLINPFEC
jgi:toxin FitB